MLIGGISLSLFVRYCQILSCIDDSRDYYANPKGLVLQELGSDYATAIVFLVFNTRRTTQEMASMGDALFATQIALSQEQKLTDLGGVIAAAAHELGTPLATIQRANRASWSKIFQMIPESLRMRSSPTRSKSLPRYFAFDGPCEQGKSAPKECAISRFCARPPEPHVERGKIVNSAIIGDLDPADQPKIYRHPEIIHGLRAI